VFNGLYAGIIMLRQGLSRAVDCALQLCLGCRPNNGARVAAGCLGNQDKVERGAVKRAALMKKRRAVT
jgi:hypothetical protein